MQEGDRLALQTMLKEFEDLTNISEDEFKAKATAQLRMSHYTTVFNVASRGTKGAKEILFMHFQTMLTIFLLRYSHLCTESDEEQFESTYEIWRRYKVLMAWNLSTFRYFAKFYRVDLEEAAVSIFVERIWRRRSPAVFRVALKMLHDDRNGVLIETSKLVTVLTIASMSQIADYEYIYTTNFINPCIQQIVEDYTALLEQFDRNSQTAAELFEKLQSALDLEEKRCALFFPCNRQEELLFVAKECVRTSSVSERRLLLSEDGLLSYFENEDLENIKKYFDVFFAEESCLFPNVFQKVIERCGNRIWCTKGMKPRMYAQAMIELRNKGALVVEKCFGKSPSMSACARRGIENVLNEKVHFSELLAPLNFWECFVLHIDYSMRHQQEEFMDVNSLSVLCCLRDDMTALLDTLAESMLQRILFPDGSFHFEEEKKLVEKLVESIGHKIPQLDSILSDLEVSNSFMETLNSVTEGPKEVDFFALRMSNWIMKRVDGPELLLPEYVKGKLDGLRNEYLSGTKYRTFRWCHHASSAEITAIYDNTAIELHVTAPQAVVLLSFNDRDEFTVKELCEQYQISVELLKTAVLPLLQEKLLLKENEQSQFDMNDQLRVNQKYKPLKPLLRLGKRSTVEAVNLNTKQEHVSSHPNGVDALVVQLLKEKSANHDSLVQHCKDKLPYAVTESFVKSRIEQLIRKGHITRSESNRCIYSYVT